MNFMSHPTGTPLQAPPRMPVPPTAPQPTQAHAEAARQAALVAERRTLRESADALAGASGV
ncbi:hypothetical protein [Piscinibacter gummiphilus]|uniref:Uncharacterized protein n=1 Tax=Piscinibacter gummiphilus TaxID=946333 RepID=A0A1W6L680_9BURK|nr:hypothetical protein [Piscinibacter gummiphilus]ARN19764.1 hypothetical protein A4W93_07475 [Piscinibacter gummiphilus]ATU64437.1 hypothetical protein CPZ87_07555 [Piscinibacter gummiphilus]GLS95165.1 hypothetical protein GCM10007918_24570 [Piscinibacter gummiphilus]